MYKRQRNAKKYGNWFSKSTDLIKKEISNKLENYKRPQLRGLQQNSNPNKGIMNTITYFPVFVKRLYAVLWALIA